MALHQDTSEPMLNLAEVMSSGKQVEDPLSTAAVYMKRNYVQNLMKCECHHFLGGGGW